MYIEKNITQRLLYNSERGAVGYMTSDWVLTRSYQRLMMGQLEREIDGEVEMEKEI